MQSLRRPKLRDQTTQQIKRYIVSRKLVPSDRLPTETQLADTLGVSRLSVREATKSLEFLGIVEAIESHRRIVDLLAAGRVAEATAELRQHIESHKERLP